MFNEFCTEAQTNFNKAGIECSVTANEHWISFHLSGNRVVHLVGYWLYVPKVEPFDPEDDSTFEMTWPCNNMEPIVNAVVDPLAAMRKANDPNDALPGQVIKKIRAMRPEPLKLHVNGTEQILHTDELAQGNCNAWVKDMGWGWKIGVRGCRGRNLYLVAGMLYVSTQMEFDAEAFAKAEMCDRNADTIVAKLKKLSVNWLSAKIAPAKCTRDADGFVTAKRRK